MTPGTPRLGVCLDCATPLHLTGHTAAGPDANPTCPATGAAHRPDLPAPHPWQDPTLSAGQRIAAALDAGLALGERLATCTPGSTEQQAYAAGWHDGWTAAEHHNAQQWRHLAHTTRLRATTPTPAQLAARRSQPDPTSRVAGPQKGSA
jgi:hypothetical protein